MCWCGVDAVALRWEGLLLLVGPYADWLKRACEAPVVMVAEVDGLRLITADKMSLLRRVPDVLLEVRTASGLFLDCWVVGLAAAMEEQLGPASGPYWTLLLLTRAYQAMHDGCMRAPMQHWRPGGQAKGPAALCERETHREFCTRHDSTSLACWLPCWVRCRCTSLGQRRLPHSCWMGGTCLTQAARAPTSCCVNWQGSWMQQ